MPTSAPVLRAGTINTATISSANTATVTTLLAPLPGSYLLLSCGAGNGALGRAMNSTPGGTTTHINNSDSAGASSGILSVVGYLVPANGSVPALTLGFNGLVNGIIQVAEYLNVDPFFPIDGAIPGVGTNNTTGAGSVTTAAGITTDVHDALIVAFLGGRGTPTSVAASGTGMAVEHAWTVNSSAGLASFSGAVPQPATVTPGSSWASDPLGDPKKNMGALALRSIRSYGWS